MSNWIKDRKAVAAIVNLAKHADRQTVTPSDIDIFKNFLEEELIKKQVKRLEHF